MKFTLCSFMLICLIACSKPSETTIIEDSTIVADAGPGMNDEYAQVQQNVNRLLEDFTVVHDSYPSIGFTQKNERTTREVEYLFEEGNLIWMKSEESANEGGDVETYYMHRDPEGTTYLRYATKGDGVYGYDGAETDNWYLLRSNEDYLPEIVGPGEENKFDWETDYQATMNFVRANKDKFTLQQATYNKDDSKSNRTYRFSEVLNEANFLSPTRFNDEMIKGYLNWWYPLYDDGSGNLVRHQLCSGDEDYIKIVEEAGNYRWEEQAVGTTLVYLIKGFEEGEGDAFKATVEMHGHRFTKTLVMPEFEDGAGDKLYIDGQAYTNDPKKYTIEKMKCN